MSRPKEHREKYLSTVESARERFLKLNPALERLLVIAPRGDQFLEIFRWVAAIPKWQRRWVRVLRHVPPSPPPLSEPARLIAEILGDRVAEFLRFDARARHLADSCANLPLPEAFPDPTDTPDARDARWVVVVLAIGMARVARVEFLPQHLVLLEVAAGLAPTTDDSGQYEQRLDAAGERLKRARRFADTLIKRVSPDVGAGRKGR